MLDVTKWKAFTDDKLNFAKMTISFLDRMENTVGKEENAGYQLSLFPTVFSKAVLFKVKFVVCKINAFNLDKGKTLSPV